jgi:hypothetical protein
MGKELWVRAVPRAAGPDFGPWHMGSGMGSGSGKSRHGAKPPSTMSRRRRRVALSSARANHAASPSALVGLKLSVAVIAPPCGRHPIRTFIFHGALGEVQQQAKA